MTARVILNPYAARWNARNRWPEADNALREAGVPFEMVTTEGPGEAIDLASDSVRQGFSPIIAAGGDGTIGEVANGICMAAEVGNLAPLGILPLGSANDLVDNLKLSRDLREAASVIAAGKTKLIDVCQVNKKYFVNNSGLGLEPFITLHQQRIPYLRGNLRYIFATLWGISKNPSWTMQIDWDDGSYNGPVSMVSVGNAPRTGGVFYTVPHADPFDGKLTFVYGYLPTRLQILAILPRTMRPDAGSYVEHPAVHEINSTWLRLRSEPPTPMHADGEIYSPAISDISYCVYPARLPILLE